MRGLRTLRCGFGASVVALAIALPSAASAQVCRSPNGDYKGELEPSPRGCQQENISVSIGTNRGARCELKGQFSVEGRSYGICGRFQDNDQITGEITYQNGTDWDGLSGQLRAYRHSCDIQLTLWNTCRVRLISQ